MESALRAVRSGKAAGAVGRPKGSSNSSKRSASAAKKENKAATTATAAAAAASATTAATASAAASAAKKKNGAGAKRVAAQSATATTVTKKPAARKKPKRSRPGTGTGSGGGGPAVKLGRAAESASDEDPRFWDKAGDGDSESDDRGGVGTDGGGVVDADGKEGSWCAAGASSSVFDFRRDLGDKAGGSGKRSSVEVGLVDSPRPARRDRVGIHADFMIPREECDGWASMRVSRRTRVLLYNVCSLLFCLTCVLCCW